MPNRKLAVAGLVWCGLSVAISMTSIRMFASHACGHDGCSDVPVLATFIIGAITAVGSAYAAVIGLYSAPFQRANRRLIMAGFSTFGAGVALSIASFVMFGNRVCVGWSCSHTPDVPTILGGFLLVFGGAIVLLVGVCRDAMDNTVRSRLSGP